MVAAVRGIDHVGITVPDIEEATAFFTGALGARVLYDTVPREADPPHGIELERRLGLPPGTVQVAVRMLAMGDGPGVELFEFTGPDRRPAARASDYGLQHLAVYVDDLRVAADGIRRHGGDALAGPAPLPGPEAGTGNVFRYFRAPWGTLLELLRYPAPQPYERTTAARRWTPRRRRTADRAATPVPGTAPFGARPYAPLDRAGTPRHPEKPRQSGTPRRPG